MKNLFLFVLTFLFFQNIFSQSEDKSADLFRFTEIKKHDFSEIDNYVRNLKIGKNVSPSNMVELIIKKSTTKLEKARAIYIWIAENIAYDTSYKITTMEAGLKARKGVCQAYSGIFQMFGELAGLEVVSISGDSKQLFYKKPSDLDKGGHAWNAFKLDDERWILVDATWGAGYVANNKFTREPNDFWFDTKPKIFIFTHFPKEEKLQFLDNPISRNEFLNIPPLQPKFLNWGFDVDELFSYYINEKNKGFPDFFSVNMDWKIIKMPVTAELKKGATYEFIFEISEKEEIAIVINDNDWHKAIKNGNRQTISVTPEKKGTLTVMVKRSDSKYSGVFKYSVK